MNGRWNAAIEAAANVCRNEKFRAISLMGEQYNAACDDCAKAILALREADQRVTAAHELPAVKAPTALASSDPEGHLQAMSDAELPVPAAPNMVLVPREQWDIFLKDYNRYVDGDPKMPFGVLRESLAALLTSTEEARNAT